MVTLWRAIHRTADSLPLREISTPEKKSKDNDNQDQNRQHVDDIFAELDVVEASSGDENEQVRSPVTTPVLQHVARGLSFSTDILPIHVDTSLPSFDGRYYAKMDDNSCQEDSNSPTNARVQ
jgi:negative regulator of genetic competence, sporulation and motility